MDNSNCNTEHKKYQHLTSEERHIIEVRFNIDKWSIYAIAKSLGRPYNTIKNEVDRGTVYLYNGKVTRYKADKGEEVYLEHRKNSRRNYRCLETAGFLKYVEDQFFNEGWSLDSAVGNAKVKGLFTDKEMVCTKTLYNYVDLGLLKIKNIDLPEKLKRSEKSKKTRENKKKLGNSIEQRPDDVDTREEFGHWEIDSVIGKKNEGEPQVMTLVERKLRESIWIKVRNHSAEAIDEALTALIEQFGDKYNEVFKSITGDNGSEFANLSKVEAKGKQRGYPCILPIRILPMKKEQTNVITECCVDSFPRGKALMTTVRMTFCSSPTKLTICRERYSAIIHRRSFSSRSLIESTGLPEPRRREFSSLVATLLPRKTRGNLLQTKKLFQLAIAICV